MRALFVGYGSIARRHVANLHAVLSACGEPLEADVLRRAPSPAPEGVSRVFASLGQVEGPYDAVFVTNPTSEHYRTLLSVMPLAPAFFVEKPAFDDPGCDLAPFDESGKLFYVACPLRYTSVLRWVEANVDFSRVHSVRATSSSYLPDWRPGQDYRDTYSAHRDQGGGVSIDLIHEWDYLQHLLGFPTQVHSIIARRSKLEIDSDDVAIYVADYSDKVVELHLDYFGRATQRALELIGEDDTVLCDLVAGTVLFRREGRLLHLEEGRDDYQRRELECFLDMAVGRTENTNDLRTAVRTLRLAKGRL